MEEGKMARRVAKSILVGIGIPLFLSTTPASAQSSVTVYGIADAGVGQMRSPALNGGERGLNKGQRGVQMLSGQTLNNGNSRLGFRGVEDLGGGLKIGFNLEGGLSLKDGRANLSGGEFWSRKANLWIEDEFGRLILGRQFNPTHTMTGVWELLDLPNYSVIGTTYNYVGEGPRNSSQLRYVSPNLNGLTLEGAYVLPKDNNKGRGGLWDLGASYVESQIAIAGSANQLYKGSRVNYEVGIKYKLTRDISVATSYNAANTYDYPGMKELKDNKGARRGMSLGVQYRYNDYMLTLDLTRDFKNRTLVGKQTNGLLEGRYLLSKRTFLYVAYLNFDGDNNYNFGLQHSF